MLNYLVYSGSARQGNFTRHVANFVNEIANKSKDVKAEVVSPQSVGINFENEGTEANFPQLREKVIAADGFILVAPEYNHGYSASLKYLLDLNLKEYIHKPVALVGVSAGPFGGTRVIESLINVVRELGMVVTFSDVTLTGVQKEIKEGKFSDPQKWEKRVKRMLEELNWMATTLKHGRENIPSQYHQ